MSPSKKSDIERYIATNTFGEQTIIALIDFNHKRGTLSNDDKTELLGQLGIPSIGSTYDIIDGMLDFYNDDNSTLSELLVKNILMYHKVANHISSAEYGLLTTKLTTLNNE